MGKMTYDVRNQLKLTGINISEKPGIIKVKEIPVFEAETEYPEEEESATFRGTYKQRVYNSRELQEKVEEGLTSDKEEKKLHCKNNFLVFSRNQNLLSVLKDKLSALENFNASHVVVDHLIKCNAFN